jgi:hypothetical protein
MHTSNTSGRIFNFNYDYIEPEWAGEDVIDLEAQLNNYKQEENIQSPKVSGSNVGGGNLRFSDLLKPYE